MDQLSPLVNGRIEQARYRFCRISEEDSILPRSFIHLLPVVPLSQNGPQCGLVALTMGLRYLTGEEITVADLFNRAVQSEFTKQGEMFEASDLLNLSSHPSIVSTLLTPLPSPSTVVQSIIDRSLILIPYDCDRNHEPAMRKGVAAHWAIIVGVLVVGTEDGDISSFPEDHQSIISDLPPERLFVLAYHGKSKHLGVWSYADLVASNLQMTQLGDGRREEDFIVKDASLGGLRDKAVLLS
ncbi:hypothetical protein PFISCL1PPCAC_2374, partial [Pristionchus fissidentatus]